MRIVMWSGPRNLSTAMMYSFAQRSDCEVVDEPFYAAYLAQSGLTHPMQAEILASQPNDPTAVIAALAKPPDRAHRYEKHMTHHMLPDWPLDWLDAVTNVFLIRHPARVIASYAAKRENPTLDDIGFRQQFEIFERVAALGQTPIVVDSFDIRQDPKQTLTQLCRAISIGFEPAMLSWPKGGNPADGVWARHWYGAVHNSTGFAGAEGDLPNLSGEHAELAAAALPFYRKMQAARI